MGTEFLLNNGERIKGDQLRLVTKELILADDGVLVADEAFEAMRRWFKTLAESRVLQ